MPFHPKITHNPPDYRERLRHSVILLVLLDLVTLGLYSAVRCYSVHAELSRKKGRRLFSTAFLHILIILNLLLGILRFSRFGMPWDLALMMAQLGSALLMITLLLIFRKALHQEFKLRLHPLPLAVFGFWYLQHQINRGHEHASSQQESWLLTATIVLFSLIIRMALTTLPWALG